MIDKLTKHLVSAPDPHGSAQLMTGGSVNAGEIESLAVGLDSPALQEKLAEYRKILATSSPKISDDLLLIQNIEAVWSQVYGPTMTLWPPVVQTAFKTISSYQGLPTFEKGLAQGLQSLRLTEMSYPALTTALQVIELHSPFKNVAQNFKTVLSSGIIPEGAARAGLHFVSDPLNLAIPVWAAGSAGKLGILATSQLGKVLALSPKAITGISTLVGLTAESATFVGVSNGIAGLRDYPVNWNAVSLAKETGAATLFFGGLKIFGQFARFAQSILSKTELGMAITKLTGHSASVTGLASMETIQEAAGIAPATSHTFYEKLVRAFFLHTTLQAINRIVDIKGVQSEARNILTRAEIINEWLATRAADMTGLFATEGAASGGRNLRLTPDALRDLISFAESRSATSSAVRRVRDEWKKLLLETKVEKSEPLADTPTETQKEMIHINMPTLVDLSTRNGIEFLISVIIRDHFGGDPETMTGVHLSGGKSITITIGGESVRLYTLVRRYRRLLFPALGTRESEQTMSGTDVLEQYLRPPYLRLIREIPPARNCQLGPLETPVISENLNLASASRISASAFNAPIKAWADLLEKSSVVGVTEKTSGRVTRATAEIKIPQAVNIYTQSGIEYLVSILIEKHFSPSQSFTTDNILGTKPINIKIGEIEVSLSRLADTYRLYHFPKLTRTEALKQFPNSQLLHDFWRPAHQRLITQGQKTARTPVEPPEILESMSDLPRLVTNTSSPALDVRELPLEQAIQLYHQANVEALGSEPPHYDIRTPKGFEVLNMKAIELILAIYLGKVKRGSEQILTSDVKSVKFTVNDSDVSMERLVNRHKALRLQMKVEEATRASTHGEELAVMAGAMRQLIRSRRPSATDDPVDSEAPSAAAVPERPSPTLTRAYQLHDRLADLISGLRTRFSGEKPGDGVPNGGPATQTDRQPSSSLVRRRELIARIETLPDYYQHAEVVLIQLYENLVSIETLMRDHTLGLREIGESDIELLKDYFGETRELISTIERINEADVSVPDLLLRNNITKHLTRMERLHTVFQTLVERFEALFEGMRLKKGYARILGEVKDWEVVLDERHGEDEVATRQMMAEDLSDLSIVIPNRPKVPRISDPLLKAAAQIFYRVANQLEGAITQTHDCREIATREIVECKTVSKTRP